MFNEKRTVVYSDDVMERVNSFGLVHYQDLITELDNATRPESFGNRYTVEAYAPADGLIDVMSVLEAIYAACDDYLTPSEVTDYLEKWDGALYETQASSDNSYNYAAPISNNLQWYAVNNEFTDETLVFVAVHIGLDVRAGYTSYAAFLFDESYNFFETLATDYELNSCTVFNGDHEPLQVVAYGNVLSDVQGLDVTNLATNATSYISDVYVDDLQVGFADAAITILKDWFGGYFTVKGSDINE